MEIRQRQTAFKVKVSDVLNGEYFVRDGWEPNYIVVNGNNVSRVNIIGVIVSKQSSELSQNEMMVLDDGSGRVSLKSFEQMDFSKVKVGDVVVLVGRPREYGGEIYIVPEIINLLQDKRWVEVRKIELEMSTAAAEKSGNKEAAEGKDERLGKVETEEILYDEPATDAKYAEEIKKEESISERIIKKIKELDDGNGADIDEIINKLGGNTEGIVNELLKTGDIFELKPGKLKVLE